MRFVLALSVFAVATAARAQEPTYWQDIRPVFRKHCTVCHSTRYLTKPDVSGGLALDTYEVTMKGTTRPVVTSGQAAKSVLIDYLTTKDAKKRMPLDADPLPAETIALVRRWIDGGAKEGKKEEIAETTPTPGTKATVRKRDVLLTTDATVPAGVFGKSPAGKLGLGLKVGPLAPVAAVAFSPDGKLLAAGSYGQVVVWDRAAARPVKLLTNVLGAVNDLKFSPDGKILAVAGGQPSAKGDLRLYQVSDWKLLAVLRGHDDVIFSIAFSPDGKRLVSASFDHALRLWDVPTRQSVKDYHHHSDFVYAAAIVNDRQFASASKDRSVQLFDAATGKGVFTFSGMNEDVLALAVSPDGQRVVSSGFEPALYWWNPQTGEKIKTQGGHGVAVHELAFSKDGKRLVSAGADRTIRTWDGTTGAPLKAFAVGSSVYAVAISPDNKTLASGSFDGLVRLWDEKTGKLLATLLAVPGDDDQAEWLALTPEGYTAGSDKLRTLTRWRLGSQEVNAEPVWAVLRQPQQIARALRGEAVPALKFKK